MDKKNFDVEALATLAALSLTQQEKERIQEDILLIAEYCRCLESKIEYKSNNIVHSDCVCVDENLTPARADADGLLETVPYLEDRYVSIPRVIPREVDHEK